jgi:hypothetical protein
METVALILGLLGQTSLSEIQKWKSEFEVENRAEKKRENCLSAIVTRAAQTLFLRLGRFSEMTTRGFEGDEFNLVVLGMVMREREEERKGNRGGDSPVVRQAP